MYKFNKDLFYKFNLALPKPKQEIILNKERNNTVLYSFILIIFSLLFYLFLTFIHESLIISEIRSINSNLDLVNDDIKSYTTVKRTYLELINKSTLLDKVLNNDMDIFKLLSLGDELVKNLPNINIRSYSKETESLFTVNFEAKSLHDVELIFDNATSILALDDLFLNSLAYNSSLESYIGSLSFSVDFSKINNI